MEFEKVADTCGKAKRIDSRFGQLYELLDHQVDNVIGYIGFLDLLQVPTPGEWSVGASTRLTSKNMSFFW